jgi:5'-deoxynucleotidase YfbR-like HD superfamily hydrolase
MSANGMTLTEPQYLIPPDQADAPAVCIKTSEGIYFDLLNPQLCDIKSYDIAHGLSHLNRFVGHTPEPYSVGEHCLLVSNLVERRTGDKKLALAGLLHDATEAYLGDVSGLLKRTDALAGYRDIEDRLARVIEKRYNLPNCWLEHFKVKQADKDAFEFECSAVRDSMCRVAPTPKAVRQAWMDRLAQLYHRTGLFGTA